MVKLIQPSFAKGEIAPALYGRVDTRAYQIALKRARNMIVHQYGGISNRPGKIFLAPVNNHILPPRLIPFQFKTTDTHVIELGHEYIRVLRNDAHVTDLTVNITAITQASPGVITSVGHGLSNGAEVLIVSVSGMTQINNQRYKVANVTPDTFTLVNVYSGVAVDTSGYTAYVSGGTASRIFTLVTPYQQEELRSVKYIQTADIMTLVHPNHPPRELQRFAINDWRLVDIVFTPDIDFPITLATSGGSLGVDSRYTVTAIASNGEESLPAIAATAHVITAITNGNPVQITSAAHGFVAGDIIHIDDVVGMTELNDRRFTVTNETVNTFELLGENGTTYNMYVSGGNAWATFIFNTNSTGVTLTWDAVVGAVRYRVFKKDSGVFGFIASTDAPTFLTDGTESADLGDTPPRLVDPFRGDGNQPRAVGFHQQRMVMGGTDNRPDTSYFSVVGNFHNFSQSVPIRANDGFSTTLASREVNELRHYMSVKDLLMLTSGSEWIASGTAGDARFSVDTIQQQSQTNWGSSDVPPILIGQTVLFVEPTGNRVRSSAFRFEQDHYVSEELSLMVPHMLKGKQLMEWGMIKAPDPIVLSVRDDGQALCLTFNEEQEVLAWTTWDTDGLYQSVATVRPSINSVNEEAYFVVTRIINGYTVNLIERTHDRLFENVRDCFFIDSGLSLDVPFAIIGVDLGAVITVTSTGHPFVNGDEVDIFDIVWATSFDAMGNEGQPDQLNANRYEVANATANTFTLKDIDSGDDIDGTTFAGYIRGGTVRETTNRVTGLFHLPNTAVTILADGNVIDGLSVDALGVVELPQRFSRIHIGLPYTADIETLDPEPDTRAGRSIQAQQKNIPYVTVRFENSRGLWIGPDNLHLKEMKQREFEDMDNPTELLTGDRQIIIPANWNSNGRLFLRQRYPLPMSILAIMPNVEVGER